VSSLQRSIQIRQTTEMILVAHRERGAHVGYLHANKFVCAWFASAPLYDPPSVVRAVTETLSKDDCVRWFSAVCPPLRFYSGVKAADLYLANYAKRVRRHMRTTAVLGEDLAAGVADSTAFLATAGAPTREGKIMLGLVSGSLHPAWIALHLAELPDGWEKKTHNADVAAAKALRPRLVNDASLVNRLQSLEAKWQQ